MSDPFIAEIRIMATNFAPTGWAFCNGQLLPIAQYTALFTLLGTTYGGNGQTDFALPNLQGHLPMQQGQGPGLSGRDLGEVGGSSAVTLLGTQIPAHTHTADAPTVNAASTAGNSTLPTGKVWARYGREGGYSNAAADTQMAAGVALTVNPVGGDLPHNNMPPYLALNFVIAMQGIYPSHP
jgi:microcystin-dependent protein